MAGKTCAICGKPSGMYPLCFACMKEKNNGNIVKCEECNTWHKINEPCHCNAQELKVQATKEESPNQEALSPNGTGLCIICGNDSGNKYFCKSCYNRFKNQTITLKITNCIDFEIDETHKEGIIYICKDGHKVRSKSERIIDDYLFENKISHAYEKVLDVDGTEEHEIKPDFYLNDYDAYLEHWGYDEKENPRYGKIKRYKLDIYEKMGLTIICTNEDDMEDPERRLRRKLNKDRIEKGKINFDK